MQVVGYEPATDERTRAALLIADDGTVTRELLVPGGDLQYRLGERRCAGDITDDTHTPCEQSDAPYCETHRSRWACARCVGDCDLPLESCREEHAVYLAAFAPETFKVGVTRSWRLETRLREQGADRAAHLQTVENGKRARQIEAEIAADVGDRVRVSTKIDGLHRDVDEDAWAELLAEYDPLARYSFDYEVSLDERPVAETIGSGTVLGTKGRILVVAHGESTYAVDMRDLVGHELSEGWTEKPLQSCLDAFEL
jgi:hypothetical protein